MLRRAVRRLASSTHRRGGPFSDSSSGSDWRIAAAAIACTTCTTTGCDHDDANGAAGKGVPLFFHPLKPRQRARLSKMFVHAPSSFSPSSPREILDAVVDAHSSERPPSSRRRDSWFAGLRGAWAVVRRATELSLLFVPVVFTAPFVFELLPLQKRLQRVDVPYVKKPDPRVGKQRRARRRRRWYASLRHRLERAGPAFIKWARRELEGCKQKMSLSFPHDTSRTSRAQRH